MDLQVSPDIGAFWCYLIVLLLGIITAKFQVQKLFPHTGLGIWMVWRSWLLFLAYVAVPLVLFWLVDRMDAVNDTSLFAAIIIGVGYDQILSGEDSSFQVQGALSRFWQPLRNYANWVAKRVLESLNRKEQRFRERLIDVVSQDSERLVKLEKLARNYCRDISTFDQELNTLDTTSGITDEAKAEQKARLFYDQLHPLKDHHLLLKDKEIVDWLFYVYYSSRWRSRFATFLVLASTLAVLGLGFSTTSIADMQHQYAVWRLNKVNATALDLQRTRVMFATAINEAKRDVRSPIFDTIINMLRDRHLKVDRIELIIQLLLEYRHLSGPSSLSLVDKLINTLRTSNENARLRIHRTLLFLAAEQKRTVPKQVSDWQPDNGDSVIDLEQQVNRWRKVWYPAKQASL